MSHAALKIVPGIDQNETPALNETGFTSSQLIRFFYDRTMGAVVQKLGGWTKFYASAMPAITRALWAWADQNATPHLAIGTQPISGLGYSQLGVLTNNNLSVITPNSSTDNIAPVLATTAGSSIVVITDTTTTGITQYDAVFIKTHIAVGGLILYGLYQCTNPTLATTYYDITAQDALGNPLAAAITSTSSTFVGGISGTTLTTTSGTPQVGQTVTGGGALAGTVILSGGGTSWQVNLAQTISTGTTFTGNPCTVAAISTTSGLSSITVILPNHGYAVGSTYPVLVSTTVGGITLLGNYIVQTVPNAWSFTLNGPQSATATTTGYINGGNAQFLYSLGVGPNPAGSGYGVNAYGYGAYGTGSSLSPSSGTPISATDWTLDNWGGVLVSCPITTTGFQPIYAWDPTSGAVLATAIANAPVVNDGMFVAMPQRQIIAWGSTFTGVQDPLLVRWCDVNNYNTWIGQVTNQAGSFRLTKGSKIVGGMQGPQQSFLWTDVDIWSMQYIGQPYIYSFNEVGTGCGLIGRKAMGSLGGSIYWMGPSSFYSLTSNGVQPLPCPIWDVIFQQIDTSNLQKIRVAVNSRFGEIAWYFPTISSGGEVAIYAKYNPVLNAWDFGNLGRSAWVDQSVLGPPIGANTQDLEIYQHETSNDADGSAMLSSVQTGYFAAIEGDYKVFIDEVWPDMKWGMYGGSQTATVNITFYGADYPGQTPTTYGPYPVTQGTTFISPRLRNRLISIGISSNDLGSFWRMGNVRYRFQQDGRY